jgi:hypothetical protein
VLDQVQATTDREALGKTHGFIAKKKACVAKRRLKDYRRRNL